MFSRLECGFCINIIVALIHCMCNTYTNWINQHVSLLFVVQIHVEVACTKIACQHTKSMLASCISPLYHQDHIALADLEGFSQIFHPWEITFNLAAIHVHIAYTCDHPHIICVSLSLSHGRNDDCVMLYSLIILHKVTKS